MRLSSILILLLSCVGVFAQPYYPVKIDKKWGMINPQGEIVLSPVYDAIGEFKKYGYAVMQKQGRVGLLNTSGREVVLPRYDDLKVLDSTLVAVMDLGEWMVINLEGKRILDKGYEQVKVWDSKLLAFQKNKRWGVVDRLGNILIRPLYDEIIPEKNGYFLTTKGEGMGLLNAQGKEILPNKAFSIHVVNDQLIFYQSANLWGAVDHSGKEIIPPKYEGWKPIADGFYKLVLKNKFHVYSTACDRFIALGEFDDYYPFSKKYLITKKNRHLGLLSWCGNVELQARYGEIQAFSAGVFRVNFEGKWGLVQVGDKVLTPFQYDYIAPLRHQMSLVKKASLFGLINSQGEELVAPGFDKIQLQNGRVKAYSQKGEEKDLALTVFQIDKDGLLKGGSSFDRHYTVKIGAKKGSVTGATGFSDSDYVLPDFEWFYSPLEDRWGLRKLEDGSIQIKPAFQYVQVEKESGFTLVGIEKPVKYEFERTTFRFDIQYGLVNNNMGVLVTDMDFLAVYLEDFTEGAPLARCIFSNGRYGLIDRIARTVKKDFAFIGPFKEGMARMSLDGYLSGSLKQKRTLGKLKDFLSDLQSFPTMVDYTQYDQLFRQNAYLVCEACEWGYIDTLGSVKIPPAYSYALDFLNGVAITECEDKWGMLGRDGKTLIPCRYDGIEFLENTGNKMVRLFIRKPKYGLIDTLGQLTVNVVYDEIGDFSEGRLAVKRDGMWGYVNRQGIEVIPCRFRKVKNFHEGLAAATLGSTWGFIDKQGDEAIAFKYRKAGNFNNGLAWVDGSDGLGFIDRQANWKIEAKYEKAFDFFKGVARVVKNGKYGLIDTLGNFVLRPHYDEIEAFNEHNLAIVRYGREVKYGVINLQGTLITTQDYKQIDAFKEGLALVKSKSAFGYIDTTGRLVIPAIFSKASAFSEGRAAAYLNGNCGYIDIAGRQVIDFEFSKCQDFDGGKAVVYSGIKKAGLVDVNGEFVFKPSLNRLLKFKEGRGLMRDDSYRFYFITEQANIYKGYYQQAREFNHGVAVVQINNKWGVINQRGIELIPPKYDKIETFRNGYAKVRIKDFKGLSNLNGELIATPDFEYISYAGNGLFRVEQGDKIGYFDADGKWVWGLQK